MKRVYHRLQIRKDQEGFASFFTHVLPKFCCWSSRCSVCVWRTARRHDDREIITQLEWNRTGMYDCDFGERLCADSGVIRCGWVLFMLLSICWSIFRISFIDPRIRKGDGFRNETKDEPSMKKHGFVFGPLMLAILFLSFALFRCAGTTFDPLESHCADMLKAPNSTYIFSTGSARRGSVFENFCGGKAHCSSCLPSQRLFLHEILVGTIAGFTGGIFDNLLIRISDMLMAFPQLYLYGALVSFISVGLPDMILAMSLTGWTY